MLFVYIWYLVGWTHHFPKVREVANAESNSQSRATASSTAAPLAALTEEFFDAMHLAEQLLENSTASCAESTTTQGAIWGKKELRMRLLFICICHKWIHIHLSIYIYMHHDGQVLSYLYQEWFCMIFGLIQWIFDDYKSKIIHSIVMMSREDLHQPERRWFCETTWVWFSKDANQWGDWVQQLQQMGCCWGVFMLI